jgi:hypothetical protein
MRRHFVMGARVALALSFAAATAAEAQGNLGTQGLGYPVGQLSTRARSLGGAVTEQDPITATNPASVALWGRAAIHVQFEPERRATTVPGASDQTAVTRFPMIAAGIGLGSRAAIALHISSFLDRTWINQFQGTEIVGRDTAQFTELSGVRGALADTRFVFGVQLPAKLRLGVSAHAITGEHRLNTRRAYDTSSALIGFSRSQSLRYTGRALSVGAGWDPVSWISLGVSKRFGGDLDAVNDTVGFRANGRVPDRWGAGLSVEAARGFVLSARHERVEWTALRPLIESPIPVSDGRETSLGAEYSAASIFRLPASLRLGWNDRQLPFGVGTSTVRERGVAGGLGLLFAGGRFALDLGYQVARRSTASNVSETGSFFSLGLAVRP